MKRENSFTGKISTEYKKLNIPLLANGMVYSTLVALIPIMAIVWFIFQRLGTLDRLTSLLKMFLTGTFGQDMGNKLNQYIEKFTENATGLGITGIISFLFTFVLLIDKIWKAMNSIFEGNLSKIHTRFFRYFIFLVISSLVISACIFTKSRFNELFTKLEELPEATFFQKSLRDILPYCVFFIVVFCIYYFVHNGRSGFITSLLGALLCTFAIGILTYFFSFIAKFFVNYSIIYGTLASILIFLVFLSWCWQILFFFALMVHALDGGRFNSQA